MSKRLGGSWWVHSKFSKCDKTSRCLANSLTYFFSDISSKKLANGNGGWHRGRYCSPCNANVNAYYLGTRLVIMSGRLSCYWITPNNIFYLFPYFFTWTKILWKGYAYNRRLTLKARWWRRTTWQKTYRNSNNLKKSSPKNCM